MKLTVCICSHNPRASYLSRTLQGLRSQTLDAAQWELLLVDNHSTPKLEDRFELDWHPNGSILIEPELGLTAARIRGFRDATADLVLMVDDDNVLDPQFLQQTLEIATRHPELGAWGASIEGEFEVSVPKWLKRELLYLAIRPIETPQVAPQQTPEFPTPAGAGMTVRRPVFERYVELIQNDPLRKGLDRKGNSLISAGDTDLAMCAWDLTYGLANFPELKLTHLIPAGRMTPSYLSRLHKSMAYSAYVFKMHRGEDPTTTLHSPNRIVRTLARELLKGKWHGARFFISQVVGARSAHNTFKGGQTRPSDN